MTFVDYHWPKYWLKPQRVRTSLPCLCSGMGLGIFKKGDMDMTNQKQINVYALQRAGNHAVINWIIAQQQGFTCFLNDVRLGMNLFSAPGMAS